MELLMSYALTHMAMIYLVAINIVTFIVYGIDKRKAQKGKWRIPEKTLFALAVIGGSLGAFAGMYFFRHKTKHWYFKYGIPAILMVQAVLLTWLRGDLPL